MKHCSNNSLLSCDKAISFLLDLIGHVLLILKYVLKKHDFDEKLTQSDAQVAIIISRFKKLSSPALCGWSGAFNFMV